MFDSLNGFLSPLELLTRPSLRKYAAFLQESGYFGEFSDDGDHQIADLHLKQPELATSKARDAAADEKETRITAALVTACATGRVGLVKCLLQCGANTTTETSTLYDITTTAAPTSGSKELFH